MADAPAIAAAGRSTSRDSGRWTRWHVPVLTAVCALVFLTATASLPLADPEEARCAQIVREMIRSGDWLVPHLHGEPYHDKPAPFFWLAAGGELLVGNPALGGRLVSVLAAIFAVLTTYALGRRMFGPTAGLIAGFVLATSSEFWYMARWYRMDMPFAAAMWAAVAWLWRCERPGHDAASAPRWVAWCGFYFFCGLATLFKGPAGLGLPVLIAGAYFLLSKQARRIAELFNVAGIALFALIVIPWYAAAWMRDPAYVYEFLFRHNLMRFGSTTLGHSWPGILFVPILLLGLIPWTIYLPGAALRFLPRRGRSRDERPQTLLLWLAALTPLMFFAFSGTKLVGYVLPCFPPLAVLIGDRLADWIANERDDRSMHLAGLSLIGVVVLLWAAAAAFGVAFFDIGAWLVVALLSCAGTIAMMALCLARGRHAAFVAWAVSGFIVLLTFVAVHTESAVYERLSTRTLAALIPDADRRTNDFYMWPSSRHSFMYYIDAPDASRMQRYGASEIDTVVAALNGPGGVYVLVSGERNLSLLRARCRDRVHLVEKKGHLWLVANHPLGQPAVSEAIHNGRSSHASNH